MRRVSSSATPSAWLILHLHLDSVIHCESGPRPQADWLLPALKVGVEIPIDSEEADDENRTKGGRTLLNILGRGYADAHSPWSQDFKHLGRCKLYFTIFQQHLKILSVAWSRRSRLIIPFLGIQLVTASLLEMFAGEDHLVLMSTMLPGGIKIIVSFSLAQVITVIRNHLGSLQNNQYQGYFQRRCYRILPFQSQLDEDVVKVCYNFSIFIYTLTKASGNHAVSKILKHWFRDC